MFTGSLFQIKLYLLSTALLRGFQTPHELENTLSKALPGKFLGSDAYGKRN